MNIDSVYLIGKSHKVCQDYAIHGLINGNPYFILSDGCSSSENVDIGARLLVHSAKINLTKFYEQLNSEENIYVNFGYNIVEKAYELSSMLNINNDCLDATLIIGFVKNNSVYIYIYGDGIIMAKDNLGNVSYRNFHFTENAPFYLSYCIDLKRYNNYVKEYKNQLIIENSNNSEKKYNFDSPLIFVYSLSKYKSVIVSSDGFSQYLTEETIKNILDFKSTTGEFIKRRIIRHISDLGKINIYYNDDVSLAGVNL